jgi:hypothetical protein
MSSFEPLLTSLAASLPTSLCVAAAVLSTCAADLSVGDGSFFYVGDDLFYAQATYNFNESSWGVVFFSQRPCSNDISFQCFDVNVTWNILANGEPPAGNVEVNMDVVQVSARQLCS